MTTLSIKVNEKLARAVEEIARLPEEEQERYAEVFYDLKLAALREDIRKGLESPAEGDLDMEAIKRDARAEWEQHAKR